MQSRGLDGITGVPPIKTSTDGVIPTKALHYSSDKSGVDQIPVDVLMEWGQVYTFGASKYGRDNWKLGTDYHEFYASALRHLFAFWGGEDIDPESGLSHLVHALWNIAAIRHYQNKGLGTDDRTPVEREPISCPCGRVSHERIMPGGDLYNA